MSTTFIHKFIRLFFHLLDRRDENVVLQNGSDLACTQLGQLIVTEIQLGDVLVLLNNAAHHFNRVHVQVAADQSFQTRSFRREFDQKKKKNKNHPRSEHEQNKTYENSLFGAKYWKRDGSQSKGSASRHRGGMRSSRCTVSSSAML